MRKAIVTTLGLLIVVALGLMINPTARDEIHWRRASHNNDVTSYESYMKTWPHGRHITEAKEKLEFLHWKNALAANTIKGFEQYVQLRPDGKFVAEAKRKAAALRNDLAPFEAALKTGSEDSLKAFLSEFPGHVKWTEAQQILKEITEGRDIVDLLKEKKIEVKTEGSDIESVSLSVRRRVPYPLTVRIPVGTYFVSDNPSTQNMVATEETKIELSNDDWTYESIPAACANRTKEIPSSDDRFTIRRSPHQSELAKLISFLAKAGGSICRTPGCCLDCNRRCRL